MPAETLIAEFTNGSKRSAPKLTIAVIGGGRRTIRETRAVADKSEARAVARYLGAQPWNF